MKFILFLLLIMVSTVFAEPNPREEKDVILIKIKMAEMIARDQTIRDEIMKLYQQGYDFKELMKFGLIQEMQKIDNENTKDLRQILKTWGWPSKSKFGEKSSEDVWLLVQHADHDLAFQTMSLDLLKNAVEAKEADKKNYAYLWDRVQIHKHLVQRYGTQGICENHKWKPYPIENVKQVNALRKAVGLDSFEVYKEQMMKVCN